MDAMFDKSDMSKLVFFWHAPGDLVIEMCSIR